LLQEAFSEVRADISSKKIFLFRKMERIKKRELENLKKKMMNKKIVPYVV
jgi:flagellar biosynthesis regulator FlaF